MITVVVGKEIEKIKGDFESYLNGLNMVGEISYSQYSELYDEGVKQIQRAYELGKSELEKENAELKDKLNNLSKVAEVRLANWQKYEKENTELKLKLEALEGQTPWKDIKDKSELIKENAELKEENKKWKDEWQEQVQKENDESYARTLQTIQLNKAKELIKRLMDIINHDLKCFDTMAGLDIKQKAEQFLKECE